MPSGKVHSFTTIVLSGLSGFVAYHQGYPLVDIAAVAGGCLAGVLLTPDLDVNRGSISNKYARRIGCVFGAVWAVIWKPYSLLIPHRSPLSHFPILGTAIRLAYMAGLIWLVMTPFHLAGVIRLPALPTWWPYAFAGLALSDTVHFVMDKLFRN